ncbi:MAG: pantetheine-phosphate adenylyltransferase [Paludibacteraceae bacterium]|nr:pantetheine-phosphate adenylyltransferase [Paludibacteraceae bacterium]
MKKAIFPGSFDPFTIGHHDIVLRGLQLFDEIIIGVGHNINKRESFPLEERLLAIKDVFKSEPRVKVLAYDNLTVDFATEQQAQFILRGVRSIQDFEYERNIAEANKLLSGIETVLLYTRPEYAHISSTLLRDLHSHNKDITSYLPPKQ